MTKQLIHVHGHDKLVQPETASKFRGIHWAVLSLLGIIVITLVLLLAVLVNTVLGAVLS